MLIRALIVLLVALNLGVASWWMLRADPVLPAPALPVGVAQLQLVDAPQVQASVPAAEAAAPASPAPAVPASCIRLGPYADAQALAGAGMRLKARGIESHPRQLPGGTPSGYRVLIAPAADRAAAQALAARIAAAGFDDFLIIGSGAEANSIALGRYRSHAVALNRQQALQAAGFAALLEPVGATGPMQWWLESVLPPGEDGESLRQLAGGAQALPQPCAATP
ncbi:SPOR domain-containing protein [Pseudoxanthomonas mexicana]|uniref:SPOR domain-containing protein n=1 Tax=Pseudoxanthomonas mexicana TaxID=128785 RepID=UPI00398B4ED1